MQREVATGLARSNGLKIPQSTRGDGHARCCCIDSFVDIDGDQISDRLTLHEVTRVAGVQSVVTAAGNFNNAVRIRSVTERNYRSSALSRDVKGTFTRDEWYVRDIGLVRF